MPELSQRFLHSRRCNGGDWWLPATCAVSLDKLIQIAIVAVVEAQLKYYIFLINEFQRFFFVRSSSG